MRQFRYYQIVLLALLGGCVSTDINKDISEKLASNQKSIPQKTLPIFSEALFDSNQTTISPEKITKLSPLQKQKFLNYFNDPLNSPTPGHERVANYLSIMLDRFIYSDKTLIAEQALNSMSGNCLSLAGLTTAFADLAEVDIQYHLLAENPVFNIEGDLLIRSDHLRSVLTGPWLQEDNLPWKSKRGIRIDYFPTTGMKYVDNIAKNEQSSMFYSNIAVESIFIRDYDKAFAYAKRALDIDSQNKSALNSMGIIHRRRGDLTKAEEIYRFGASTTGDKTVFLRNLSILLNSQSRFKEALSLNKEISKQKRNNPWQWVNSGRKAQRDGDFHVALSHYQRALSIAPDLHQVHSYIGVTNYVMGHKSASRRYFQNAIDLASAEKDKASYQRKLNALSH
jgi:tetratricopeptide (TPR) repeat protein